MVANIEWIMLLFFSILKYFTWIWQSSADYHICEVLFPFYKKNSEIFDSFATETCSQETSPTKGPKTCPAFVNTSMKLLRYQLWQVLLWLRLTLVLYLFKAKSCLNCQAGWEGFGSQCYYFSNNTSEWEKAREQCQQQGADLVQVSSEEEQVL